MDMAILIQGIEIALSLANSSAMAKYNMTLNINPLPACSGYTPLSKDYWACVVRQDTGPENHQAGSCKMGPPHDPMAVVDNRLRVHGIRNLRVADASIMPQVNISRNIIDASSITIYMLLLQNWYSDLRAKKKYVEIVFKGNVQQYGSTVHDDRRKGGRVYQVRLGRWRYTMVRESIS